MNVFDLFLPSEVVNARSASAFMKRYAREDGWHDTDMANGNFGLGWIHYALIRMHRPKRVLCIGSRYGYIPAICALACKDNGGGIVDFVDAGFDENNPDEPNHWGGAGLWKRIDPSTYFAPFGLAPYISLHVTTTRTFAKRNPSRWGYIYVDGDHSYEGAKHDFETFWPRLLPWGIMGFHDIHVKRINEFNFGVWRLWREIQRAHPARTTEFPGRFGLGLVTKPGKTTLLVDV